jgi:glycosyltransferase involved in cell wall biosynthesis
MRVALLSTYDERGGAARAALRLHRSLPAAGVESRLLVQRRFGREPGVLVPRGGLEGGIAGLRAQWRPRLESIPVRFHPGRRGDLFSPSFLPDDIAPRVQALDPDVVHLHWVGFGFVRPETLPRLRRPLVWTLHDSWPFTGGCHLPGDCVRYREACGACPALGSNADRDLSRRVHERKRRAWSRLPVRVVAPSRWIADAARASALFRKQVIEVIPNGIDLDRFRPIDRDAARATLGIPPGARVLFFSALEGLGDRNKGFDLLREALAALARRVPASEWLLLVAGIGAPEDAPDCPVPLRFAGPIDDEDRFALHLAASDLLVLPSRLENQPNLAVEAMACGRPVVAFRAAGIPEVVAHQETGYLAAPYDPEGLAAGIAWIAETPERGHALGERARARAERLFGAADAARRHRDLYAEVARDFAAGRNGVPASGETLLPS